MRRNIDMDTQRAIFHEMGFTAKGERLSEAVLYSVARTCNLLVRELARVYQPFGLSAASFNLLMLLKHGADPERMTQQEVGKRLVVSASDMTGLLDRLEKKGLVQRIPGKDRRSKLLRITAKGQALLDEVWPKHLETVERLAGRVGKRHAAVLVGTLAQLRAAVA